MAFAFLFPGQGSQSLKMMDGFADVPVVRETFAEAAEVLSQDLWAMLAAETPDAINVTVNTQPLMLTAGVAVWRAWLASGGARPAVVAGHSLGEYSALVAAEVLSFRDALRLVNVRAQAMQDAVTDGQGAMAAILGLADDAVARVCQDVAQGEVVCAVNFNSPGQIVIAGDRPAVERAMAACKEAGAKRAQLLPVSVPCHCALMKPAADKLAQAWTLSTVNAPRIQLLHNADVASYAEPEQIRDTMVRQLYSPVRWTETIHAMVAQGITQMAECGPGRVLTGLCKRIDASARCIALTDAAALEQARNELQ